MKLYPLKLSYITKTALWGGTRLRREWHKNSEFPVISESWELSVRPKEPSLIIDGEAEGMKLEEYISACGNSIVSPSYDGSRFPLLIKLIDAADTLSVQVHPDDSYASEVEYDSGKTEMWYIIDADENSELIYGLKDGVSTSDFASAVRENRIGDVMNHQPVKAGETYFIPSGMLHAIGKGILIAEIQQNSDLTYRVYDFDRRQSDGSLRELHVDKAIDVTRPFSQSEIDAVRYSRGRGGKNLLANSEFFRVELRNITDEEKFIANASSFVSLLCIYGTGKIIYAGQEYNIEKGDSYFLPAGMGEYTLCGDMKIIESGI